MAVIESPRSRGADATGVTDAAVQWQASLDAGVPVEEEAGYFRIGTTLDQDQRGQFVQGAGQGDPEVANQQGTVLGSDGVTPLVNMARSRAKWSSMRIDGVEADPVGFQLGVGLEQLAFEDMYFVRCGKWFASAGISRSVWMNIIGENPDIAFDFPNAADDNLEWLSCHVKGLQANGIGWKFGGGASLIKCCSVINVSNTTAACLSVGSAASINLVGFLYENNQCRVIDTYSPSVQTVVTIHGAVIDTTACTASTPALINCNGIVVRMFGPIIKGAQSYPTFASISGGGALTLIQPVVISPGGSLVNPRGNLPGLPAATKIMWNGGFV